MISDSDSRGRGIWRSTLMVASADAILAIIWRTAATSITSVGTFMVQGVTITINAVGARVAGVCAGYSVGTFVVVAVADIVIC